MIKKHFLFDHEVKVNDYITIMIPTVGEVIEDYDNYYSCLTMLTSTPYDMMVQLDDMGLDYTKISEYELFLILFHTLSEQDTSLLFGNLDLSSFRPVVDPANGSVALRDPKTGNVIDILLYMDICGVFRKMHGLERRVSKPLDDATRRYIIDRARKKLKRRLARGDQGDSHLEDLVVAYVNAEQTSCSFEDVSRMTIYQFNESLKQVIKKTDYNNRMRGIYAGTVSAKDMSKDDLNWLTHK
jgi:hypothetical protein